MVEKKKKSSLKSKKTAPKKAINKKTSLKNKATKTTKAKNVVKKKPIKKVVSKTKRKSTPRTKTKTKLKAPLKKTTNKIKTKVGLKKLVDYSNPSEVKKYFETHHKNHPLQPASGCFFKDLFSGHGFYNFVWFPLLLLLFTIFIEFALQFVVFTTFPPIYVALAQETIFYKLFAIGLITINVIAYFFMGSQGSKHNFRFPKVLRSVFKITIFVAVVELILTTLAYFTFLQPYVCIMFASTFIKKLYLCYILIWVLIKYIVYLLIAVLSYILFKNSRLIKI